MPGVDALCFVGIAFLTTFRNSLWRHPQFIMKAIISSLVISVALTFSASAADSTVKLSDVHICCDSCVKGIQKAIEPVKGVSAAVNKDEETVTLTGPDKAALQKGADALTAAGYFGKSSDASIKLNAATGAKGQKVQSLKINDVHLCCGKCVKAVNTALESVPGVKANTAKKDAKSFEITGDFNDKEAVEALQKIGLTGKVE
jgi:mercuric ion binding protein